MEKQTLFAYVKQQYGTEPEYLWNDENAVLRRKDSGKWYAAVLPVCGDKLGLSAELTVDILNVKCDPILIGSLRQQAGFHPAYHMNKEKWISIRLDGSVDAVQIENLLAISYELTAPKKNGRK